MPHSASTPFTPADAARLIALEARYRRDLGRRVHEQLVQAAVAAAIKLDQHVAAASATRHSAELRTILDGIRDAALGLVHELRSAADDRGYTSLVESWAREVGIPVEIRSARGGPWPDGVAAETAAWWTTVELLAGASAGRARIRLCERRAATSCVILADGCHQPARQPAGFELCRMLGARVTLRARDRRLVAAVAFPARS
jgi:hypothetical protein